MKKINAVALFFLGLLAFSACEDDRDNNPTLLEPTTFVLNTPAYASTVYDLKHSKKIEFACSQPDYGFTAATDYAVQLSLDGAFSDEMKYATLPSISQTARMHADAIEMNDALVALWKAASTEAFPTTPIEVYVRLKASLSKSKEGVIYSNVIKLDKVLGYDEAKPITVPTTMYIVGSSVDWNWDDSADMIFVHSNPGKFWAMQYFNAGDQIKFNFNKASDGNEVGYKDGMFSESSIALAGLVNDNGNLQINNAGWYIVVMTSELVDGALVYAVEFLEPNVYLTGDPSGGYDVFDETRLFVAPKDGTGEFVSQPFAAAGELRICIKLADIDWWKTEFVVLGGNIEFRAGGGDQERVSVVAGQKAYLNFKTNKGSVK